MPTPNPSLVRTPAVATWLRLVRVFQKVARGGDVVLRGAGITGPQFDLLATVASAGGEMPQQALAERLSVTKGNVTQLLTRLEEAGHVRRTAEGRGNRVHLTARGRRLLDGIMPAHDTLVESRLAVLTADEQATLRRILRKLDRSMPDGG